MVMTAVLAMCASTFGAEDPLASVFQQETRAAKKSISEQLSNLRMNPELLFEKKEIDDSNCSSQLAKINSQVVPLLQNKHLDDAAQALCTLAIDEGINYVDDNITRAILEKSQYVPSAFHMETTGVILNKYISIQDASRILYENFKKAMLDELPKEPPSFFKNDYVEFGVGYCGGALKISKESSANVYLMTIILASPAGPQPNWIQCGHVYYDKNNNKAFDPGEGLAYVTITDDNETVLAETEGDGSYCFRRPLGDWTLYLESFPFVQDYVTYQGLLENNKKGGILFKDYMLLLTQESILALKDIN